MTQFTVLSLFPEMFEAITASGITSRAIKQGLLRVEVVNPREFTQDRHRTVDDRPYGGGPGMLMMVEPLRKALVSALSGSDKVKPKVVYMSPQGKPFTQKLAQQWAAEEQIILVAGRYEGIDQRFIDEFVDEEVSLGDFVVSGGELPEAAGTRQRPGRRLRRRSRCRGPARRVAPPRTTWRPARQPRPLRVAC